MGGNRAFPESSIGARSPPTGSLALLIVQPRPPIDPIHRPELTRLLADFTRALDDEIREARLGRGTQYPLRGGRRLGGSPDAFLYVFSADFEIFVPEDSPVELRTSSIRVAGSLLSVEGLTIFLQLEEDIGDEVAYAELRSEPWYLLEALKERLLEIDHPASPRNALLALTVLGRRPARAAFDWEQAHRTSSSLERFPNPAQQTAVAAALGSDVAFIWGPPGTGKTSTLAVIARALHDTGGAVLVVSHSNAAVDMAIKAIAATMQGTRALADGAVVRFGTPRLPEVQRLDPVIPRHILRRRWPALVQQIERLEAEQRRTAQQLRATTLSPAQRQHTHDELQGAKRLLGAAREELEAKERDLVRSARLVACTLSKAALSREVYERHFDAVVIDEASMAYVPQVFFAASLSKTRCVILGDFRQLPPVALADTEATRTWLRRDIFDHAGIIERVERGESDPRLSLLDTQYRMHPRISAIVNRLAYGGLLRNADGVASRTAPIAEWGPGAGHAVLMCDIGPLQSRAYRQRRGQSFSHFNPLSAFVAMAVAREVLNAGATEVGVISPYVAQARLVHRLAHDLGVDQHVYAATVHRFQGWERQVIVFDAVDALPFRQPGVLLRGDIRSEAMRLLNVAVSRAQGKIILVGDLGYLRSSLSLESAFAGILLEMLASGGLERVDGRWLQSRWTQSTAGLGVECFAEQATALQAVTGDIIAAQRHIAISYPDANLEDFLRPGVMRLMDRRVRTVVAAPPVPQWQQVRRESGIEMSGPPISEEGLVLIDSSVFWILGWPGRLGGGRPSLRITLVGAAAILAELTGLQRILGHTADPHDGLGRCRSCNGVFWSALGPHGPYLKCQSCGRTRRLTPYTAGKLAAILGLRCERCGALPVGRNGLNGVFLGCRNYPACQWTADIARWA